jgi:regulator of sigma E protease
MEGMIMTVQLLLSLSILIAVHEAGHFFAARAFNIKVEKFYLFFDFLFPMANVLNFSLLKIKKGDTEYGIGWFPLGGYVKIAGMVDESMDKEAMKAPAQPWEFRSKPAWQRLIVMLGGVIVNVVVGVVIFVSMVYLLGDTYIPKNYVNTHGGIQALELGEQLGLKTGDQIINISGKEYDDFQDVAKPDVLLSQNSYYTVLRDGKEITINIPGDFIENFNKKEAASNFVMPRVPAIVGRIAPKTIAEKIALQEGDQFVEVDSKPVFYFDELSKIVKSGKRDSISFKVKRGEQLLSFKESFKDQEIIGFNAKGINKENLTQVNYSIGQSLVKGTERAFTIVFIQIKGISKMFTGQLSVRNISSPIGIAQIYGSEWDWERFWRITGLLSMVLAIMNLLPIPGLDGGYVVFLLYEMISGREPSEKFLETSLKVGMGLLLLLMLFGFSNDIAKLLGF